MKRSFLALAWLGGTGAVKTLGKDVSLPAGRAINYQPDIVAHAMPVEARLASPVLHSFSKWNRSLRADIYDELQKLPMRFALHPFGDLERHCSSYSAVGVAPPMGPADELDVIPFFVHRNRNGRLPGKLMSVNNKQQAPSFFLNIHSVEGDMFRFEEELLKIFPTKKIFVRQNTILIFGVDKDAILILHHWLLGLGF